MSKPAVLFLHGAGGGAWEWNVWVRIFRVHGFEVHAPDFLPADSGLAATTLDDYRRQVRESLLLLGSPTIIVGASLGGLLALMNAEHADAVVLINPMPPAPLNGSIPLREKYPAIIPWGSRASLAGTRRALFDSDEITCLYAFRHWRDESGTVMNDSMAGVDIAQPNCPLLILASEQDDDVPFHVSRHLAENLKASFINLPATSHVGPLLGKTAAQCALMTVAFLNDLFR